MGWRSTLLKLGATCEKLCSRSWFTRYIGFGWNDIAQIKGSLQKDQLKILLQKYYLLGHLAMHFVHQSNAIV